MPDPDGPPSPVRTPGLHLCTDKTDMEGEVSSDSKRIELNEENNDNRMEKTTNEEGKVNDPEVGMLFSSIDEIMEFYTRYGKEQGFPVCKRSSTKGYDGEVRYVTVACSRHGKSQNKSSMPVRFHPITKTDCKAKLRACLCPDGMWRVNSIILDHNHELSPAKSQFFKCNRKRRLEMKDRADIRMNKNFNSLVVEAGGYENLTYLEKDCRNYRPLRLGEGDATALHNYFLKMQADNSDFFYMMDLDQKGQLSNVFWADARSRAAFKEFGDVVTFDTTYLTNKYDMPFTPFVGVNHHGQSMLLGCGLISSEDTETFIWLFQCWLTCMSGCHPSAIVTDQDRAMKNAIEVVFPNAQHRWCLWHIMKKLPEKLRGYNEYESIKFSMQNAVYDSLSKEEFENSWCRFIANYNLESNEWLTGLYEERHRWVPVFVKNIFWAGMSITRRSESMHAFFDGYVNSKTSLKQFVEQYENALQNKVEKENNEDFGSFNSWIPCITRYEMEKQFQSAYTRAKFKEFQEELIGKISCDLSSCKEGADISEYEIGEDLPVGESHRHATFKVWLNHDTCEVNCNCQLFEFSGILCRHAIMVLIHNKIYQVPDKYIFKRWSKTVKRSHTKVRISYNNWFTKPEARRFDKMRNAFCEVADLAIDTDDKCEHVMRWICQLSDFLKKEDDACGSNQPISIGTHNDSASGGDGLVITKESSNILTPVVNRSKGRQPYKRKQSNVEKAVQKALKIKGCKKKMTEETSEGNIVKDSIVTYSEELGNVHGTAPTTIVGVPRTQASLNLNDPELQQLHHGPFGQPSGVHGGSGQPNIYAVGPFGQPSGVQGGSCQPNRYAMSPFGQPSGVRGGSFRPQYPYCTIYQG